MKELIIQVCINNNQIATVVQKKGFNNQNPSSTTFEVIGILQNLIRMEQDKLEGKTTTVTKEKND